MSDPHILCVYTVDWCNTVIVLTTSVVPRMHLHFLVQTFGQEFVGISQNVPILEWSFGKNELIN